MNRFYSIEQVVSAAPWPNTSMKPNHVCYHVSGMTVDGFAAVSAHVKGATGQGEGTGSTPERAAMHAAIGYAVGSCREAYAGAESEDETKLVAYFKTRFTN